MLLKSFEHFKFSKIELLYDSLEDLGWTFNLKTRRWDIYDTIKVDEDSFLMDENGATFPMGYVYGLSVKFKGLKSLTNFPIKIGRGGLNLSETGIKNLKEFPLHIQGDVNLTKNKIENLKDLSNTILEENLLLSNNDFLTSLEGCPILTDKSFINIYMCKNLKTLYGLKRASQIGQIQTSIPNIEYCFFMSKTNNGQKEIDLTTYWQDLYWFIVEGQKYEESYKIAWPVEFLNTLPVEYQNTYRSNNSISKYSL